MSKNPRRKPGDVLADLLGDDEDKESKPTLTRRPVPKSSNGADSVSDVSEADVDEIARQLEEMDDMEANLFRSKKPNKALEKKKGVHDIKDSPEKAGSIPSAVVKPKKIKFDDFDEDSPLAGLLSDEDDISDNKISESSNQKKKTENVEVPVVPSVKDSSESPSKEIVSILKKPSHKENVDFDGDEDLLDGLGLTDSPPARRKSSIKEEASVNKDSDSRKSKSFLDTLLGKTENTQSPEKKASAKSDAVKFGSYMPTFGTSQTSSRRQSSTDELKEWLKDADSLPSSNQKDTSTSNTTTESKPNLIENRSETERGKSRTVRVNDERLEKEDTPYSFGSSAERRRGSSRPRPKLDWLDTDKSAFADGSSTNESSALSNSVEKRNSDQQENRTGRSSQKHSSSDWLGIEDNLGSSNENVDKTVHSRRTSSIVETSLKGSPSLDELLQPKSTSTPRNRLAENEGVRTQSQGQSEPIIFQRDTDRSHFAPQLSNAAASSLESTVESRLVAGSTSADVRKAVSAGEVIPPFDSSKVIQRPRTSNFLNMEETSNRQFLHPKPVESRSLGEISNYDVSAQSSSSYIPPSHNVCPNCIYLATSGKLNALNSLELKVGHLEMEKTELRETQKVIQNHQKQEIELLKEAYKYHVKQLEEALESKELRLKTEINNLEQEIQNKSQKWEKEKRSILDTHQQQIESLRKEWAKEMDEMKSLYKQSVSELKQNQSLLSDRMKFFSGLGELNSTSLPIGPMQNSAFQPLLDHITRQNEELQRMKERLNDYKQNDKGEQEIRYHFLNEQIRQQQSSIDLERSQMKQLILRLEEQLYQRTNSTEDQHKLEIQRQKLMEEQAEMKQYLAQGLTELERAKMKFNEDRERLLEQLQEVTQVEVTKRIQDLLNTENSEEIQKLKVENELQTIVSELLNKEHYLHQLQEELKLESEQLNHERLFLEEFRNKLESDREEIKLLARQVQSQLETAEEIEMSAKHIEKEGLASLELSRKMEEEQQSRMQALQQQLNTVRSKEQHLIQEEKKITHERIALKNIKSSFICPSCSVPMVFAGNNSAFPPPSASVSLPLLNPSIDNVNLVGNQSISEPVLNKALSDLPSSNDVMVLLDKANRAKLFTLNSSPTALNTAQYTTIAEELLSGGFNHHHRSNNPLLFNASAVEWPPRTEGSSFEANLLSYKMSAEKDRQDLAEEEYFLQSIANS